MAHPSTRARALGLARRLAAGALQRIAREVDRLSLALEPVRGVTALREPARKVELEVSRWNGPRREAPRGQERPSEAQSRTSELGREVTNDDPVVANDEPVVANDEHAVANDEPTVVSDEPVIASGARTVLEPAAPDPRTPALLQVGHLRGLVDPRLASLRDVAGWEQAEDPVVAVHRARVATRRLRAFVRLYAPLLGGKRARKLERRLRAITRALGPVREHDVLTAGLRALQADAEPLARAALEHVEAWAQGQRRKAARRAHAALADVDAAALAEALEGEVDRVSGRLLRHDEPLAARATALLEPELARAFEGMPRPTGQTDMEALHEVRIRAKRLRYALALLDPLLCEPHRSLPPLLERVQSTLGEHREAAQLLERVHERRAALAAQGLPTLAGALDPVEATLLHRRQRAFERAMRALARLDALGLGGPTSEPHA